MQKKIQKEENDRKTHIKKVRQTDKHIQTDRYTRPES